MKPILPPWLWRGVMPSAVLACVALLPGPGCLCHHGALPYAVVREAQFRTEDATHGRITLPLDAQGRERLIAFLRAAGNTQEERHHEAGAVNAPQSYAALLDWLAQPHSLGEITGPVAPAIFTGAAVYEIVDAREARPLSDTDVVARSDGNYWWIFFHPHDRADGLLVTPIIGVKPARL